MLFQRHLPFVYACETNQSDIIPVGPCSICELILQRAGPRDSLQMLVEPSSLSMELWGASLRVPEPPVHQAVFGQSACARYWCRNAFS